MFYLKRISKKQHYNFLDYYLTTDTQEEMIRGIQQQIRVCVPDLDERVRQQEEALERASQEQTM